MARGRHTSLSVSLTSADREALASMQRSSTTEAGLAKRACLILSIGAGISVSDTARMVSISRRLVYE
jgi:hypothetical protein